MGRRSRRMTHGTVEKTAFDHVQLNNLRSEVTNLFAKIANKDPVPLTRNSFIDMFVEPEHRATFKVLPDLIELGYGADDYVIRYDPWEQLDFAVGVKFQLATPPVPKNATLQFDYPEDQLKEFVQWLVRRGGLIKQFSLLWECIEELNKLCKSPAEVAYFLPGVQVLRPSISRLGVKNPASLPQRVKHITRLAQTLIATTQLIEEDPEVTLPVVVTVQEFRWHEEGYGEVTSMVH